MEEGVKNFTLKRGEQEEKRDNKTRKVDINDVQCHSSFEEKTEMNETVSFMDLIPDVRRIIFKNLDFVSKYNLSLIWKDMAEEFWRNVDVDKRWKRISVIDDNLVDLEYAGVLASAGFITQVDLLSLYYVDVSSIPTNIINSLAKIVEKDILLQNVKGWRTSMLNDVKCMVLIIRDMNLDSGADKRPIKVLNDVKLENVTGDLEGLMERLTYGPVDQISIKSLIMKNMDISKVPGPLLNSLFKTIRTEINLRKISGISFQLMSGINCERLHFADFEFQEDPEDIGLNMSLNIEILYLVSVSGNLFSFFENIKHCRKLYLSGIESSLLININMTEVLKDKVEILSLKLGSLPDWLQQYDGDGMCVRVEICVYKDDEAYDESYYNSYDSWAVERGWKVQKEYGWRERIFSRPE